MVRCRYLSVSMWTRKTELAPLLLWKIQCLVAVMAAPTASDLPHNDLIYTPHGMKTLTFIEALNSSQRELVDW